MPGGCTYLRQPGIEIESHMQVGAGGLQVGCDLLSENLRVFDSPVRSFCQLSFKVLTHMPGFICKHIVRYQRFG